MVDGGSRQRPEKRVVSRFTPLFLFSFSFPLSYPSSYGLIFPLSCCIYIPSTPVPIVTSFADASSFTYCSSLLDLSPLFDGLSGVPSVPIYPCFTPLY